MIKKITLIIFITLFNFCSVRLWAQVNSTFAYEGFDYLNTADIPMNNASSFVNIGKIKHWEYSNGWAGDWQVSPPNSGVGGYHINTLISYQYTKNKDIINSGHVGIGGDAPGVTAGRPLQVSPGGPFSNNPGFPLGAFNAYNGLITKDWPSVTGNKIGRNGTSLFVSLLLQKTTNNTEPVYVTLHSNALPYNIDAGNNIGIGYFGLASETAGVKFWSLRINGTVLQSSVPIDLTKPAFLVFGIDFNSVTTNTIQMWADPAAIGVTGALIPIPDISTTFAGDNTFTTLGYNGGSSPLASTIDEIRFAGTYLAATQSSGELSLISGLCPGNIGDNVYPEGTFGKVGDDQFNGSPLGSGDEQATFAGPTPTCPGVNTSFWCVPNFVNFRKGIAPWSNFSPAFTYDTRNYLATNQLDDGNNTIVTEVRGRGNFRQNFAPACNVPSGNFIPEWINIRPPSNRTDDYLMMLNCNWDPSVIYDKQVPNICSGVSYEFSIDMVNIINPDRASFSKVNGCYFLGEPFCDPTIEPGCQQFSTHNDFLNNGNVSSFGVDYNFCPTCKKFTVSPDIEFLINDVIIYTLPAPIDNDETWHKVGFTFITKDLSTSPYGSGVLRLQIRNKAPGGDGNDLALDNIQFVPCGPTITVDKNDLGACSIKITATIPPPSNFNVFKWQTNTDTTNITNWVDVNPVTTGTGANTFEFTFTVGSGVGQIPAGSFVRVTSGGGVNDFNNVKCRVNSYGQQVDCNIPLPVTFLSFSGEKATDGVALKWETTYEHNNLKFIVERAGEDQKFIALGEVDGVGNSDKTNIYHFKDYLPLPGNNYYRVKQVDEGGKEENSKVITINVSGLISVFPNPADKNLTIQFGDNAPIERKINVRFVSALGKIISEQNPVINRNENQIILDNLPSSSGVYYLEVIYQNIKTVKKVVIAH